MNDSAQQMSVATVTEEGKGKETHECEHEPYLIDIFPLDLHSPVTHSRITPEACGLSLNDGAVKEKADKEIKSICDDAVQTFTVSDVETGAREVERTDLGLPGYIRLNCRA